MDTRYTRHLLEQKQERTRLTKQLAALVGGTAEKIAHLVEPGTTFSFPIGIVKVDTVCSNIGCIDLLFLDDKVITDRYEPGEQFFLHGDLNCPLTVAERDDFLAFTNNLTDIIKVFEDHQDRIIQELRLGFDRLRQIAEKKTHGH